ncbi:MAG: hypothetical protein ACTSP3_00110 [Candidatus Heimdallarchaeaceae archaeon]
MSPKSPKTHAAASIGSISSSFSRMYIKLSIISLSPILLKAQIALALS